MRRWLCILLALLSVAVIIVCCLDTYIRPAGQPAGVRMSSEPTPVSGLPTVKPPTVPAWDPVSCSAAKREADAEYQEALRRMDRIEHKLDKLAQER